LGSRSRLFGVFLAISAGLFSILAFSLLAGEPFDYYRMARLTGSVVGDQGSGTGVVVAPGESGRTRVLTNGHICDTISVWSKTEAGQERITEKQSLYRPVKATFQRADKRKAVRVLFIVKHTYVPDLCLVEIDETAGGDFATVPHRLPQWGEEYAAGGYPNMMAFTVSRGEFWGLTDTAYPPRFWKPSQIYRIERLQTELGFCEMVKGLANALGVEMKGDICKPITDELAKLLAPIPYKSALYHIDILHGNSGSGVWDKSGGLVGIIWGITREGNSYSLAVNYGDVRKFLETAPK